MKTLLTVFSLRLWAVVLIGLLVVSFAQNFIFLDSKTGCLIRISPSFSLNNHKVRESIELLQKADAPDYNDVCGEVTSIDPNLACGHFEGGCFQGKPREISVDVSNNTLASVAQTVVTETCKAKLYRQGKTDDNNQCAQKGLQTLNTLVEY